MSINAAHNHAKSGTTMPIYINIKFLFSTTIIEKTNLAICFLLVHHQKLIQNISLCNY